MSYIISLTNGNILTTVPDTQLVSNYGGLNLIGKNYDGFGTAFNNDLVHMVENFASSTPPTNPFVGQIWYDSVSSAINFWNGTQFKPISVITSSPTAPLDPQLGDEWYDTVNQQLNIWNGFEWILIGPPNEGGAKEGFVVASIPSNTGNIYYLQLYANNELLAIVSSVSLTNPDIAGFSNIRPGWNFVTNPESTPSIIETGIYNVSEITIGNEDQLAIETDNWDNAIIQVNGGNVMIASNGNGAANTAAYTEWANGNVVGTVYFDTIVAGSYGNLPSSALPGAATQVIYNSGGILSGSNALTIAPSNVTARIDHLQVSSEANVGGNLTVLDSINVSNHIVTDTIYATSYENLPPFSIPGSTGQILYNSAGSVGATSAILVKAGNLIAVSSLSVNAAASVNGSLTVTNFANVGTLNATSLNGTNGKIGNLEVTGTSNFDGTAYFNTGGNQFSVPPSQGLLGNPLTSNGNGTTQWNNANLAQYNNFAYTPSFVTGQSNMSSGYMYLPNGVLFLWGQTIISSATAISFASYGLPNFTTVVFTIQGSFTYTGHNNPPNLIQNTVDLTGFQAESSGGNPSDTITYHWWAMGI